MGRYAAPFLDFYWCPCGTYHPKTRPHFAEQRARAEEQCKTAESKHHSKKNSETN